MAIKQLTVFVENKKGTVASVTDVLSRNNINLRALSIAETQDLGILRLIVNDEKTAEKVLLENGDFTITEISEAVGFSDVMSFSSFFSKHVGMSPTEYKKSKNQ